MDVTNGTNNCLCLVPALLSVKGQAKPALTPRVLEIAASEHRASSTARRLLANMSHQLDRTTFGLNTGGVGRGKPRFSFLARPSFPLWRDTTRRIDGYNDNVRMLLLDCLGLAIIDADAEELGRFSQHPEHSRLLQQGNSIYPCSLEHHGSNSDRGRTWRSLRWQPTKIVGRSRLTECARWPHRCGTGSSP